MNGVMVIHETRSKSVHSVTSTGIPINLRFIPSPLKFLTKYFRSVIVSVLKQEEGFYLKK